MSISILTSYNFLVDASTWGKSIQWFTGGQIYKINTSITISKISILFNILKGI